MKIEKRENRMDASLIWFDELTPLPPQDEERAMLCPAGRGWRSAVSAQKKEGEIKMNNELLHVGIGLTDAIRATEKQLELLKTCTISVGAYRNGTHVPVGVGKDVLAIIKTIVLSTMEARLADLRKEFEGL
jgi:hypothetical protein